MPRRALKCWGMVESGELHGDPLQNTGLLQRKLEDEDRLLAEVQRDKERHDQRKVLMDQVYCCSLQDHV